MEQELVFKTKKFKNVRSLPFQAVGYRIINISTETIVWFMVQDNTLYLDEADVLGVAAEALPAAHEPVLPDQSMRVATDPADRNNISGSANSIIWTNGSR
jgi:hypothetical protein